MNCTPCTETLHSFNCRGKCLWRSCSLELPRAISGLDVYLWQWLSASNSVNRKLIITSSLLWFRFSALSEILQNHTSLSLASLHLLLPGAVGYGVGNWRHKRQRLQGEIEQFTGNRNEMRKQTRTTILMTEYKKINKFCGGKKPKQQSNQ